MLPREGLESWRDNCWRRNGEHRWWVCTDRNPYRLWLLYSTQWVIGAPSSSLPTLLCFLFSSLPPSLSLSLYVWVCLSCETPRLIIDKPMMMTVKKVNAWRNKESYITRHGKLTSKCITWLPSLMKYFNISSFETGLIFCKNTKNMSLYRIFTYKR